MSTSRWFAALMGLTIAVALVSGLLRPAALRAITVADVVTDGQVSTMFAVWLQNFVVLVAAPAVICAVAFSARRAGHRRAANVLLALAFVNAVRLPVIVGAFGGIDPEWFVQSVWPLECWVLAISCATLTRVWQLQRDDADDAVRLLRRAVVTAGIVLAVAAVVEIVSTS